MGSAGAHHEGSGKGVVQHSKVLIFVVQIGHIWPDRCFLLKNWCEASLVLKLLFLVESQVYAFCVRNREAILLSNPIT